MSNKYFFDDKQIKNKINTTYKNLFGKELRDRDVEKLARQRKDKSKKSKYKIELSKINRKTLRGIFTRTLNKELNVVNADDIKIWSNDIFVITEKDFKDLVGGYLGDEKSYIRNQFKCGHFSLDFIDYANETIRDIDNTVGSALGVELLAYFFRKKNGLRYGHALVTMPILLDDKIEQYIIEPQNGKYWTVSDFYDYRRSKCESDFILELYLQR